MEWFAKIPWYNNYVINKNGDIFSLVSNKFRKPYINNLRWWYNYISLQEPWIKAKNWLVHRLVMLTFVWIKDWLQINHIDWNKNNNALHNLEWVTDKENKKHANDNWFSYINKIKVWKYDLSWNFICSYNSISEAGRSNNIDISSICMMMSNRWKYISWKEYFRKSVWGFIWKKA